MNLAGVYKHWPNKCCWLDSLRALWGLCCLAACVEKPKRDLDKPGLVSPTSCSGIVGPQGTLLWPIGRPSGGLWGTFLVLGGSGRALCCFVRVPFGAFWVSGVPVRRRSSACGWPCWLLGQLVGRGPVVFCGLGGPDFVFCILMWAVPYDLCFSN